MQPQSDENCCFSNLDLDGFDLDLQHLPGASAANSISCDGCSPCCPSEALVSEAAARDKTAVVTTRVTTLSTTARTFMFPDLPTSPRHVVSGAATTTGSCDGVEPSTMSTADYSITNLPDDILCIVLKFLDVKSLLRMRECNTKLCSAASSNSAGWRNHCGSLWSKKVNVCSRAKSLLALSVHPRSISLKKGAAMAMEAFKTSVVDAATRKEISLEELCYDESPLKGGPTWSFRFKESAGIEWTSWDPWWNNQQARKLVFLRDGSILQVQPQGKTAPCQIRNGIPLYDVFSERLVHRDDGVDVIPPRIELKWRFVKRPLDLPARPECAYLRVTICGRDLPTYVVRRSPNGNWGFILENCWGIYASFDLDPRRSVSSYISSRRRRRTRNGTRRANVDGSYGDDPDQNSRDDQARNVRQRTDAFEEESAMVVTGRLQWREALLYNIGTVVLPEEQVES